MAKKAKHYLDLIKAEFEDAHKKHPKFINQLQAYYIIVKKSRHLKTAIKQTKLAEGRRRAIQIGAMALALLMETPIPKEETEKTKKTAKSKDIAGTI